MVSEVAAYVWAGAATAAQENLDNLVDKQQSNGGGEADQPLVIAQRCQVQDSLQETKLGRQDGYQQLQTIEVQLVSIMKNVPVESGGGLAACAEAHDNAEERKGNKANGGSRGLAGCLVGRFQIDCGDRRQDAEAGWRFLPA
jgi:hypothetical protein